MTPDEKAMQEKKIRLMMVALVLGAFFGGAILISLWDIVKNTALCK